MTSAAGTPEYDPKADILKLQEAMNEDLAARLTCSEAEAYARLLCWAGRPEGAAFFLGTHSSGDGAGDRHTNHAQTLDALASLIGRPATEREEESLVAGRRR